jgi:hypothetical protein
MSAAARVALFSFLTALPAAPAIAQQPPNRGQGSQPVEQTAPAPRPYDEMNAEQTRERFRTLLRDLPPTAIEVFRLDPALLNDGTYMAQYPALAAFVQAHPEIVRNPRYFVGSPNTPFLDPQPLTPAARQAREVREMFQGLFILIGFMTVTGAIIWTIKTAVDHRRWLRLTRIQTEAHTKIVDRLANNEDLMAYIQTPAGRRFLEAGPAPLPAETARSLGAPYGRILWAVQAGTVVTVLGAGLMLVSRTLRNNPELVDASPFPFMIGTIAAAIGVGFLLSAVISYLVSKRLGLLEGSAASNA